jgi:hypothetical protein
MNIIPRIAIINRIMGKPKINLQKLLSLSSSVSESGGNPIAINTAANEPSD